MDDADYPNTADGGPSDSEELPLLLQRYMDAELTDAELAALDQRLRSDGSARTEFVQGLMQGALLRELIAQERSAASLAEMLDEDAKDDADRTATDPMSMVPPLTGSADPVPPGSRPYPPAGRPAPLAPLSQSPLSPDGEPLHPAVSPWQNWKMFGALSLLVVLIVAIMLGNPDDKDQRNKAAKAMPVVPVVAAESVRQKNCVWLVNGKPTQLSQLMTGTMVKLQQGEAELKFGKDVRVVLEGPVEFQPAAPDRLVLIDGSATARVPAAAVGFMVDAPAIRVTDLGTEFGLRSFPDGRAVLHVFTGAVEVELADGNGQKRIVRAGQSLVATMEAVGSIQFDDSSPVDPAEFLRSISPNGG